MICPRCHMECIFKDFYLNSQICYHCLYRQKIRLLGGKQNGVENICRICKKPFYIDRSKKIRQRTVYCSKKCSMEAHRIQKQNFWTNKVNMRLLFK